MEKVTSAPELTSRVTSEVLPDLYFTEIGRLLEELDARPRPSHSPRGLKNRGLLGDFTSVTCFKAVFTGLEDILGVQASGVLFTRAGRLRGQSLVEDWGVGHLKLSVTKLGHLLNAALGSDGTRLCMIASIEHHNGTIIVNTSDTICSAGEPQGSPRRCTFTLGAVWGAIEALTGGRYVGQQTQSVLAGEPYDQFTFRPLS